MLNPDKLTLWDCWILGHIQHKDMENLDNGTIIRSLPGSSLLRTIDRLEWHGYIKFLNPSQPGIPADNVRWCRLTLKGLDMLDTIIE